MGQLCGGPEFFSLDSEHVSRRSWARVRRIMMKLKFDKHRSRDFIKS
jgi:hypothetical protein